MEAAEEDGPAAASSVLGIVPEKSGARIFTVCWGITRVRFFITVMSGRGSLGDGRQRGRTLHVAGRYEEKHTDVFYSKT